MHWNRVSLVGVGLLGGSLGLALKRRRLARTVVGYVRRAASVAECRKAGAVDLATRDLAAAVAGADLVVLSTPIAQMRPLVERLLPSIKPGAVVTDVGSVKGSLVAELEGQVARSGAHFVGSHPMAGAEKTGVSAARVDLFVNAVCVVTPTRGTHRPALQRVEALWKSVGARVVRLSPGLHDELVSRTSHLPHVVAAELANFVLRPRQPKAQPTLCANGFRDTTRIASGSPEMWRDIALANRKNLSGALGEFIAELREFQRLLRRGDAEGLSAFFIQAKRRRDSWSGKLGSPSPE